MFIWRKEIDKLDISGDKILSLFTSMNDVQVALPGFPSQRSSAFLCAYAVTGGCEAMAILLLHDLRQLAFYRFKDVFPVEELDAVVQKGVLFLESMGFMLNDMEFKSFGPEQRRQVWETLPLGKGSAAISSSSSPPPPSPSSPASKSFSQNLAAVYEEEKAPLLPAMCGRENTDETLSGRRGYEKRFDLCRKIGRLLASF